MCIISISVPSWNYIINGLFLNLWLFYHHRIKFHKGNNFIYNLPPCSQGPKEHLLHRKCLLYFGVWMNEWMKPIWPRMRGVAEYLFRRVLKKIKEEWRVTGNPAKIRMVSQRMFAHEKGPEETQVEKFQSWGKNGAPDSRREMDSVAVFGAWAFIPLLGSWTRAVENSGPVCTGSLGVAWCSEQEWWIVHPLVPTGVFCLFQTRPHLAAW